MKSRLIVTALFFCTFLTLRATDDPIVQSVSPVPGMVASLTEITVNFSENVTGVDAADLLINGVPANSVTGGPSSYVFSFPDPAAPDGNVHVSWAEGHAIADLEGNPFNGNAATWNYTMPDTTPPSTASITPPQGFVIEFTQVTIRFSEAVLNVDARDLLVDGVPATGVSGSGETYTFTFPRPRPGGGMVVLYWALDHMIMDLSSNGFGGGEFYVYLVADVEAPTLVELRPNGIPLPLTEVQATFSEPVIGVDASDLLLNGQPALSMTNFTNNVYIFQFAPFPRGASILSWADEHGITDTSFVPNAFSGGSTEVLSKRNYALLTDPLANTHIVFSNRFFTGVCTVDGREAGKWVPLQNFFVTQRVGQVTLKLPPNGASELRLRCLSIAPGNAFVNLARAYGDISTVAGGAPEGPWQPEWEGASATDVHLSEPCFAVVDTNGNIYIAERTGHAVDKITPDGTIFTFMGRRHPGFDQAQDTGTNAPNVLLNTPSGLFIVNNTLYVLDAGNHRVRRVGLADPAMTVTTLFIETNGIGFDARGLWIGLNKQGIPNEALFGLGGSLRSWEGSGVTNLATGFGQVAFVTRDPRDDIIVADPINNRVYEVGNKGRWGEDTVLAGTGFPNGNTVGGDADKVALPGATSVAFFPIGGYFVALDQGARVWYVDADDNAAPFIFGTPGVHAGDGAWFRAGRRMPKISNVQTIALAPNGDIILVEGGVVRKIQFLRHR